MSWLQAEREFPESTATLERDGVTASELVEYQGRLYARTKGEGWFMWREPWSENETGRWVKAPNNDIDLHPASSDTAKRQAAAHGKPTATRTGVSAPGSPGNEILSAQQASDVFGAEAQRLGLQYQVVGPGVADAYKLMDDGPPRSVYLTNGYVDDPTYESDVWLISTEPPDPKFSREVPNGVDMANWTRSQAIVTVPNIKAMLRQLKAAKDD